MDAALSYLDMVPDGGEAVTTLRDRIVRAFLIEEQKQVKLVLQEKEKQEKKEKDSEAIKSAGLGLLKAVHAHEKKAKSEL